MSLKGSLQTAALPEVLQFLSSTGKTGELQVSGANGAGRLWFEEGRMSGFDAARAVEPHEAIFELLRIDDGEFSFSSDGERPAEVHAVAADAGELAPALEAAEARMAEWREIVKVVPSLAHRVTLRAEGSGHKVVLDPDQWTTVVAIGAGRPVGAVIDERQMQEFDGCRAIKALVDGSLAEVGEPEEPSAPVVPEPVADEVPVVAEAAHFEDEPVAGEAPVLGEEQVATEAPVFDDEPVFAGAMLRFGGQPASEESPAAESEGAFYDAPHPGVSDEDHYAALKAAIVEAGENLGEEPAAEATEPAAPVYEVDTEGPTDSRAALQALLSEVTAPESGTDAVDALADRGPWTDHELSAMDQEAGWYTPEAEESNIVPFAPVQAGADEEGYERQAVAEEEQSTEEEEESPPVDEPINRGLLLKFLSSVRN